MSDRKLEKEIAEGLATLRASHAAQIEALSAPGLSDVERVNRFADAVGMGRAYARSLLDDFPEPLIAVWSRGEYRKSLFASLPGCGCPIQENRYSMKHGTPLPFPALPRWQDEITVDHLPEFSRIQCEAREKHWRKIGRVSL